MNEKEYKERAAKMRGAICSSTGSPCECIAGGRCVAFRGNVDAPTEADVRQTKIAWMRLDDAVLALWQADTANRLRRRDSLSTLMRDWERRIQDIKDEMKAEVWGEEYKP